MYIHFQPNTCCGCMACADVCPTEAITAAKDERGFVFPQVNVDLCISCGECEKTCAFRKERPAESNILGAYAFQISDRQSLKLSTSGGAFTALSDAMLAEGGVIVGAQMEADFSIAHVLAEDSEGRDRMRGSKYAQSRTDGIFALVRDCLDRQKPVMFVGTPCQCGQLRRFIGDDDRLLVCDFLCHGVPSSAFLLEHIRFLERHYRKTAVAYTFRGKRYGWNHGIEEITFSDGSFRDDKRVQSYAAFFQSGVSLRDSCRSCVYRSRHRASDVTFADFWGLEKLTGQKDRDGVSLLLANSASGKRRIEALTAAGTLSQIETERVLYRVATSPARSSIDVAAFWETCLTEGYSGAVKRYAAGSVKDTVKHELKKMLWKRG